LISLNARLLIALLVAFILTILPFPEVISAFRPPWILLLVLYIQFSFPKYFHVTSLFVLGFSLDVLLATVAGEHAFALLLTTWLASGKARRFNFYSMGQQIALIAVFCLIYQGTISMIDAFLDDKTGLLFVVGPGLSSLLLWPWVMLHTPRT